MAPAGSFGPLPPPSTSRFRLGSQVMGCSSPHPSRCSAARWEKGQLESDGHRELSRDPSARRFGSVLGVDRPGLDPGRACCKHAPFPLEPFHGDRSMVQLCDLQGWGLVSKY